MRTQSLSAVLVMTFLGPSVFAQPAPGEFLGSAILPKEDTGAARFFQEHPEHDGRGVVVAIFDTGVDPGAPGLQVTSDGKPKIIDVVDGSGSGDVDTSTVVEASAGALTGLSGRRLQLDPSWHNPSGKYHLGLKRAFELYPGELVSRLVAKRREKWDERQRAAVTALERELAAWNAAHPEATKEQKKEREELEARLEQLKALQEKYDDPGPLFDCVIFHDGDVWRVAIDTDEDGDLADEKLLTDYRREHQYATFSELDLMNFAVNVYDEGNLLSIVTDSGSHGTHVAGIVAAHFPHEPELNGIAPGAQLVSVKIGDTRLGSTSVGSGEIRGCIAALHNRCDLINMSYGGPTPDPDRGRNIEIYSELVNKHGVIFVSSAGNEGPALSTAGSPGATTSAIFGVGAYVSPEMMAVQYSLRQRLPATQYTWSCRGPTYDGDLGVKFSAPGGAIAPVPNWVLARNMQMHGTSMAAPNCCGNIALLLSALKAEKIAYSPHRIRRALENTAVAVPGVEVFTLGRGLIQVDKAYEYLKEFADYADQDLRFEVRVASRRNARGVYLREPFESDRPLEARLTVTPVFHDDAPNREKVEFEMRCKLESTADWIEVADHLMLMHGGRRLDIKVDPTGLPEGVHYAELRGYDAWSPQRGPIFRLPITVIRPHRLPEAAENTWRQTLRFVPGRIERRFFAVPEGATWADIRIRRLDTEGQRTIVLQTVQLAPQQSYEDYQLKQYLTLADEADEVRSIKVLAGRTLELCLAQFWSSLGECDLDVELTFHGVVPDRDEITIGGGELVTPLGITTPLRPERVAVKASLDTWRQPLRPAKFDLRPLGGQRDLLPEERQIFELVLTYEFKMEEEGKVTPRTALMSHKEYEDSWQSQMWMIFDAVRRLVATGTSDPQPVSLGKGDYVLRFHVRYDKLADLQKLKDMVLLLDRALGTPIGLACYGDPDDALSGGPTLAARTMQKGERARMYIASPPVDKLPKGAGPGDLLLGTINFGNDESKLPGEGMRPGGFRLAFVVPPRPSEKKEAEPPEQQDGKSAAQKLAEAVRDLKVERLAKLHAAEHRELFDQIAAELLTEDPDYLPVLVEQLRRADGKDRLQDLPAVVAAADRVIARIDRQKLAAHFGVKLDPDDKEAGKLRKELEKQKAALVDALHRKARALYDLAVQAAAETAAGEDFERAFAELQKWVDTTSEDYLMLHIDREVRHGRLGQALKLLNKKIAESKPDKELFAKRIGLLDGLGWPHWKQYEERWLLIRFPGAYPPF